MWQNTPHWQTTRLPTLLPQRIYTAHCTSFPECSFYGSSSSDPYSPLHPGCYCQKLCGLVGPFGGSWGSTYCGEIKIGARIMLISVMPKRTQVRKKTLSCSALWASHFDRSQLLKVMEGITSLSPAPPLVCVQTNPFHFISAKVPQSTRSPVHSPINSK